MASAMVGQLRVSVVTRVSASSSGGKANSTLVTASTGPRTRLPKNPAQTPAAVPSSAEQATASTATRSELPTPARQREKMSRPNWSVPNQ
jgi:hypothetical protein